jgi:hypothetical protein
MTDAIAIDFIAGTHGNFLKITLNKFFGIVSVEKMVDLKFDFSEEFYQLHKKFLSFIPYTDHKKQCDNIIHNICSGSDSSIPTLFQESYINGQLENIFGKEMPFYQEQYFTSCRDVLYYISNNAPNL